METKNDISQFKEFQWKNDNNIMKTKAKEMYSMLKKQVDLTYHLNLTWKINLNKN